MAVTVLLCQGDLEVSLNAKAMDKRVEPFAIRWRMRVVTVDMNLCYDNFDDEEGDCVAATVVMFTVAAETLEPKTTCARSISWPRCPITDA